MSLTTTTVVWCNDGGEDNYPYGGGINQNRDHGFYVSLQEGEADNQQVNSSEKNITCSMLKQGTFDKNSFKGFYGSVAVVSNGGKADQILDRIINNNGTILLSSITENFEIFHSTLTPPIWAKVIHDKSSPPLAEKLEKPSTPPNLMVYDDQTKLMENKWPALYKRFVNASKSDTTISLVSIHCDNECSPSDTQLLMIAFAGSQTIYYDPKTDQVVHENKPEVARNIYPITILDEATRNNVHKYDARTFFYLDFSSSTTTLRYAEINIPNDNKNDTKPPLPSYTDLQEWNVCITKDHVEVDENEYHPNVSFYAYFQPHALNCSGEGPYIGPNHLPPCPGVLLNYTFYLFCQDSIWTFASDGLSDFGNFHHHNKTVDVQDFDDDVVVNVDDGVDNTDDHNGTSTLATSTTPEGKSTTPEIITTTEKASPIKVLIMKHTFADSILCTTTMMLGKVIIVILVLLLIGCLIGVCVKKNNNRKENSNASGGGGGGGGGRSSNYPPASSAGGAGGISSVAQATKSKAGAAQSHPSASAAAAASGSTPQASSAASGSNAGKQRSSTMG